MATGYKKINKHKLNERKHRIVSTEVALKNITPIKWSNDVMIGKKKITIDK